MQWHWSVCLGLSSFWIFSHVCRADTEWDHGLTQDHAVLDRLARVFCPLVVGTKVEEWQYQFQKLPCKDGACNKQTQGRTKCCYFISLLLFILCIDRKFWSSVSFKLIFSLLQTLLMITNCVFCEVIIRVCNHCMYFSLMYSVNVELNFSFLYLTRYIIKIP